MATVDADDVLQMVETIRVLQMVETIRELRSRRFWLEQELDAARAATTATLDTAAQGPEGQPPPGSGTRAGVDTRQIGKLQEIRDEVVAVARVMTAAQSIPNPTDIGTVADDRFQEDQRYKVGGEKTYGYDVHALGKGKSKSRSKAKGSLNVSECL